MNATLQVLLHARDLGTHATCSEHCCAATLTTRLLEVASTIARIGWLPHGPSKKATVIRMAGLAKALYGCEAAQCSEAAERKVQSAISKAIGPAADRASNAMVFTNAADGEDLDTHVQVAIRRSTMIRIMSAKRAEEDA